MVGKENDAGLGLDFDKDRDSEDKANEGDSTK
jgi:hypothetical protein